MAVSSVSSSSSIYGNRNVLTGLASGLDTESMIENVISSYKNKITALTQKRTKTEWKQEAYRSIIDKMSVFSDKYASYRSSNNLMSASFFDQSVKTTAKGKYADKVTATGRSSSDIQVNRVKQLATAATYKLSGTALDSGTSNFGSNNISVAASGVMDLDQEMTVSTFSGNMTLAYGGQNALSYLTINFEEGKTYYNNYDVADEINRQLKEQTVNIGSVSYTGDELLEKVIRAEANADGTISFVDPKKNNVYISDASASVKENLLGGQKLGTSSDEQVKILDASGVESMNETMSTYDYLTSRGASMQITLDGATRTVKLPDKSEVLKSLGLDRDSDEYKRFEANEDLTEAEKKQRDEAYLKAFQKNIDSAFGAGKLTVSDKNGDSAGIQFQFAAAQNGSTFSVSSSKGETLGFGESGKVTSFLNTEKTLGDLLSGRLGEEGFDKFEKAYIEKTNSYGNTVQELARDANGKQLYSFYVNGKEIGQFNEDTSLSTVINAMNSSSDSEVKVAYSKLTNELTFTAKNTGAASGINFGGSDSLAAELFGVPGSYDGNKNATYTKGQDAILEVSVNGTSLGEITRSSNSVELDGMTINLKGTFGYETNADGSVKYSQAKDQNGNLTFSYNNGVENKEIFAKELADGSFQMVGKTGNPYKYSSSNASNPLNGKEILMEAGADGTPKFYVENGGEKTQVYARLDSKNNLWFSVNQGAEASQNASIERVMDKNSAVKETNIEPITFETTSDADKIVDAVKTMIEDYNAMVTEIKNAYSTLPMQRSNGAYYEPLTEEDQEGMSESSIKAWEDKAKTGVLFGDNDLRSLYQRLTSAVSMTGEFGATLRAAGISVSYSNGLSTLDFNEDKFRAALDKDPDKVRDAFVSSTETGAKSNGLMQALKQPLDMYGKTSGGKGILVNKAGSVLAPSTLYTNNIQKELDDIDTQIEKWQDKMSDQVDYYTNQFSKLEQLIQQMNSQSSYFSQLMGG